MLSLSMKASQHTPLVAGEFYHLFNRANTQTDKLFHRERNYHYFLEKWNCYLGGFFEVWSYCLIPNHFHFSGSHGPSWEPISIFFFTTELVNPAGVDLRVTWEDFVT